MIYQTHLINLSQLEGELRAAGLEILVGIVSWGTWIVQLDQYGEPIEISADYQYVEEAHIAMRIKTDAEYAAEFQSTNNMNRRSEINSIISGLLPDELVVDESPWPPTVRLPAQLSKN